MPVPPTTPPSEPKDGGTLSILNRVADVAKNIVTVGDHLKRLEKEDERSQKQILELTKMVFELAKDVADMKGQMKGIDSRLSDREKMVEAQIALRVREATGHRVPNPAEMPSAPARTSKKPR